MQMPLAFNCVLRAWEQMRSSTVEGRTWKTKKPQGRLGVCKTTTTTTKPEVEGLARLEKNPAGKHGGRKAGGDHVREEDWPGLLTALANPLPLFPDTHVGPMSWLSLQLHMAM